MKKFTITDFQKMFPNDQSCLDWLKVRRFGERLDCPNCDKNAKFYHIKSRKVYGCEHCGHQLSPTAGTIFHKSRTSLHLWFYTIYLMAQSRGGISAKQIERETGVTYKTAWRICKQIRKMLDEDIDPMSGEVEVDESYFGGKNKPGKRGRGASGKTPVIGIVERESGNVEARLSRMSSVRPCFRLLKEKFKKARIFTPMTSTSMPHYRSVALNTVMFRTPSKSM